MNIDRYRIKLQNTINLIGTAFYVDPNEQIVGDNQINHWNTTLMALAYILDENVLLLGEPGFAKTTSAKVMSSLLSGFPFDLYEAAQIQGHPDQTYETMLARLDFSKLTTKEEVIWLTSAYLPIKIIDEINRLTAGNQDQLLNSLQTGRFNYLNSTLYTGKHSFFATANNPDDGNHILIPPLRDRFAIHLEVGHIGALYRPEIQVAEDNINEIANPDLTERIMGMINNQSLSVKEKLKRMDQFRPEYAQQLGKIGVRDTIISDGEKKELKQTIKNMKLSQSAEILVQMIDSEINYTPTFGRKRRNDPVDTSNHAMKLASTSTLNGLSPRGINALVDYAKGLAFLQGKNETGKEEILAMAPHALGHRLEFSNDFAATYADSLRPAAYNHNGVTTVIHGEPKETMLARKLIEGIEENYATQKTIIDLVVMDSKSPQSLSDAQREELNNLISGAVPVDSPLVNEYIRRLR